MFALTLAVFGISLLNFGFAVYEWHRIRVKGSPTEAEKMFARLKPFLETTIKQFEEPAIPAAAMAYVPPELLCTDCHMAIRPGEDMVSVYGPNHKISQFHATSKCAPFAVTP